MSVNVYVNWHVYYIMKLNPMYIILIMKIYIYPFTEERKIQYTWYSGKTTDCNTGKIHQVLFKFFAIMNELCLEWGPVGGSMVAKGVKRPNRKVESGCICRWLWFLWKVALWCRGVSINLTRSAIECLLFAPGRFQGIKSTGNNPQTHRRTFIKTSLDRLTPRGRQKTELRKRH